VIYSGKYDSVANKANGKATDIKSVLDSLDSQIKDKQQALSKITAETVAAANQVNGGNTTSASVTTEVKPSAANAIIDQQQVAQQEITQAEQATMTTAQASVQAALQQAADGAPKPNIVEIPGFVSSVLSMFGDNPQVSVSPLVQKPAEPEKGFNSSDNPTTNGNVNTSNFN
jgi:hypothetical protein